jgi:isochorismate synthase
MLESESLFVLQFPNRVEPLIRKGQTQPMNWKSLLQEKEALFASRFGSQELQVLCSSQIEIDPWNGLEIRRQSLDWEPGECLNFERFSQQVQWVKQGIAQGHFEKLVLARCAASETQENRNLKEQWEAMNLRHPQALRFAYYQPELGLWMGSTPEHLLQWENGEGRILAMAGTLKEGESWSPKEQLEQSVTGRFIEEVLAELGADFEVDALQETPYGELRHLRCEYRFGMERDQLPDLLERLNPTPAVAGYPKGEALKALDESVDFDRGAYAGVLGAWKNQSLQAWVQLRCARMSQNGTWLYAGAGINAGSEARKEWEETQSKMESLGI